ERYAAGDPSQRLTTVKEAKALVDAMFDSFGKKVRLPNNLPFYEDCGASAVAEVPLLRGQEGFADTLESLLSILRNLSTQWDEQATLSAIFKKCYGEHAKEVPLLQFFEDSFREFYKRHFSIERSK